MLSSGGSEYSIDGDIITTDVTALRKLNSSTVHLCSWICDCCRNTWRVIFISVALLYVSGPSKRRNTGLPFFASERQHRFGANGNNVLVSKHFQLYNITKCVCLEHLNSKIVKFSIDLLMRFQSSFFPSLIVLTLTLTVNFTRLNFQYFCLSVLTRQ